MISALSHFICMKGMENLRILDDRLQFLSIIIMVKIILYRGKNILSTFEVHILKEHSVLDNVKIVQHKFHLHSFIVQHINSFRGLIFFVYRIWEGKIDSCIPTSFRTTVCKSLNVTVQKWQPNTFIKKKNETKQKN